MVVAAVTARRLSAALICAWVIGQLAAPGVASAQDASPETATPRRILVAVEKGPLAEFSDDDLGILARSFLTTLSSAEGAPSALSFGRGRFPSLPADREKAARDRGADAWLFLSISGSEARPILRVSSYDMIYQVATLSFTIRRRDPLPIMDIDRELWSDVVPRVVAAYPAIQPAAYDRGPTTAVPVIIRARPGTIVSGLTQKPIEIGRDGTASVQIPSPSPYSLRATLAGYVPTAESIYFNGQPEILIPQTRSPWLLLDFALLDGFYPGVSGTLASSPFPGFVRLGFTTFRAGLALNQDQILSSLALSQLTAHVGLYFSPEDKQVRWYAGAGGLLRVTLTPARVLILDVFMPWGVQAIAGAEIAFTPHIRTYVELAPTLYKISSVGLYTAYTRNFSFPFIPIETIGALDPVEVRLGLRWVP
jgi:hypothetical protein